MEDKKWVQKDVFRQLKKRIDNLNRRVERAKKEAIECFRCSVCDVRLHDIDNMRKHLEGLNHLKCIDHKKDVIARELTGRTYKELLSRYPELLHEKEFHVRMESNVKVEVKKERYYDDSYESKPAIFDEEQYERRMKNKADDFCYCEPCDKSFPRDHLINHENGQMHLKMTRPVERFECQLCSIFVTCQDSLNNHRKGKDHLKRAQNWEEQNGRKYDPGDPDGDRRSFKKLSRRDKRQVEELKKEKEVLQSKIIELYEAKRRCRQDHDPQLVKDLKDEVDQLRRENAALKAQLKGRKRCVENDDYVESQTKFKPGASHRGGDRERLNEERFGSYGDFKINFKNSQTTRSRDRSRMDEPEVIDLE